MIVEDKDCNGRILISLHSNGIEAIIIVQKIDTKNKQVYCYIDSCILRTSLEDLENSYNRFYSKQGGSPKYKKIRKGKRYVWYEAI